MRLRLFKDQLKLFHKRLEPPWGCLDILGGLIQVPITCLSILADWRHPICSHRPR